MTRGSKTSVRFSPYFDRIYRGSKFDFAGRGDPRSNSRPLHGVWRSLVARLVWDQKVAGSNPATPTIVLPDWQDRGSDGLISTYVSIAQWTCYRGPRDPSPEAPTLGDVAESGQKRPGE